MWECIGYWPTLNDNQLNRFHFQLSRWDTKYKEFSHILSEYLPIGQCQAYIQTSQGFYIWIKYFIITSVPHYLPDIKHWQFRSSRTWFTVLQFYAIRYFHLIVPSLEPGLDTSLEHDILTVLFAETCFYGGGDCGESNTGHRQRGNQPHGTHIPVFQLTSQLYRRQAG